MTVKKKSTATDDVKIFFADARFIFSVVSLVAFSILLVLMTEEVCRYAGSFIFRSFDFDSDSDSDSDFPNIISAATKTQFPIDETSTAPLMPSSPPPSTSLILIDSSSFAVDHRPSPSPLLLQREDKKLERGISNSSGEDNYRGAPSRRNISGGGGGGVYRNLAVFYRSYTEMEKRFKVYVYEEGELPMVHDGPCKNIYSIEGRFIQEIENGANRFRTRDPDLAHVFFLPFSVTWMVKYLYKPDTYDVQPLQQFASDYVSVVSTKYPFWNRTQGADHFMLSCHDWGPHATRGNEYLYNKSIRVLCNANSSEGFNPRKDVSLPEIHLYDGDISLKLRSPPPQNSSRPYLAFFAGGLHGPIRPILLHHWKNNDTDLRVYEYLPKDLDYDTMLLQSKYCLCPSGHEVASPRIVEAIYAECVPVILSDHYVLPFSDVLRWEAFSIQVSISEIPRLKELLTAIPKRKYMRLKKGVRGVRKHFVLNQPAQRFDVFHMILHSVWLRRLNLN